MTALPRFQRLNVRLWHLADIPTPTEQMSALRGKADIPDALASMSANDP